jgi:hypothetical protein
LCLSKLSFATQQHFLIPNFYPSTHFSHHIHDSLWFLRTPLYAFYYALCVLNSSMHLWSLFKNVHWNKKRAPKNKTFAQASSMGRLTQHETTFMPSSKPYSRPLFSFLVLGLKLWFKSNKHELPMSHLLNFMNIFNTYQSNFVNNAKKLDVVHVTCRWSGKGSRDTWTIQVGGYHTRWNDND